MLHDSCNIHKGPATKSCRTRLGTLLPQCRLRGPARRISHVRFAADFGAVIRRSDDGELAGRGCYRVDG